VMMAGSALRQLIRPSLGAVQDAQNSDRLSGHGVGCHIGRAGDDELARAGDAAGTAALRKVDQAARCGGDPLVDGDRRARIVRFDMGEDAVAIGEREGRPDEFHDPPAALRRASARRAAKCVSACSSGTSGRVSCSASCTFVRNQASCASLLVTSSSGSAPSLAVR
ncbi:hypothetical protein KXV85_005078, partial [Aspergillus fumigatus]